MPKVHRKLTRKEKEEKTALEGKKHFTKSYRQKKFEKSGSVVNPEFIQNISDFIPKEEPPIKRVAPTVAKKRTFWKNPDGKVVSMEEVAGDFIDSKGITYDYPYLINNGWTKR